MKVIVCGGRNYYNTNKVFEVLSELGVSEVVHGGASGADAIAGSYARTMGIPEHCYPADWHKHGRAAGPLRNLQMLQEHPDAEMVVAFPGGRGTDNMCSQASIKNFKVLRVEEGK